MKRYYFSIAAFLLSTVFFLNGCNYITHRTLSKNPTDAEDPEPDYDISLSEKYQNFTTYIFAGNRIENFSTYFNAFYTAQSDFDEAMAEYRTSTITAYNRNLDSLNIQTPLSPSIREKLNKVIERASKVIQFHKNSSYLDDAVLLIGKSYFFLTDYLQAEKKFNEFLSNLSSSNLSDEALLYLGRTNIRLGKINDGETIFKNLISKTNDPEIKSEASQELGINAVGRKNYQDAVTYFKQSIGYTNDKEKKAEKQYLLAKILSINDPREAASYYSQSVNTTSDFDLAFYSKLNYGKAMTLNKDYAKAYNLFGELDRQYRDYPEFKQLVKLETANNLYAQQKYKSAIKNYYETIIDYPATEVAADAYYYLARHYETVEWNYLKALVNYRKVTSENANSSFSAVSDKRAKVLDRYFELQAITKGIEKIEIPTNNEDLENYRKVYEEEKGIRKENPVDPTHQTGDPKGGGSKGFLDSLGNIGDSLNSNDSLLTNAESEEDKKINAYLEISEIFLYELNKKDSAEIYLNKVVSEYPNSEISPKALYALGTIFKNEGRTGEAEQMFKKVITGYPNSVFANESRKQIGVREEIAETDSSEALYNNAANSIAEKNYREAVTSLQQIMSVYPQSEYMPKTLYSLAWIYENGIFNKDSSVMYYKKLSETFPNSEFTASVKPKLELLNESQLPADTTKTGNAPLNEPFKEEQVKPPPTIENNNSSQEGTEEKLSQEEINKVLKETEDPPKENNGNK